MTDSDRVNVIHNIEKLMLKSHYKVTNKKKKLVILHSLNRNVPWNPDKLCEPLSTVYDNIIYLNLHVFKMVMAIFLMPKNKPFPIGGFIMVNAPKRIPFQ